MEAFVAALRKSRDEIVSVLMWEICKNTEDAAKEFDRTMDYGPFCLTNCFQHKLAHTTQFNAPSPICGTKTLLSVILSRGEYC